MHKTRQPILRMTYSEKYELVIDLVKVMGHFASWSQIFSLKSVALVQHLCDNHTTNCNISYPLSVSELR